MHKKSYLFIVLSMIAAILLGAVYHITQPIIEKNYNTKQENTLEALLGSQGSFLKKENFELVSPAYLRMGDTQIAIRTYDEEGPSHIVIKSLAKGYNGNIGLMLSLDRHCTIGKVVIVSEHETPGLGDHYKTDGGAWLNKFSGKNKNNTHFDLKRNGGDFDAWSGATVTPQGIVQAVKRALTLCEKYHQPLFSTEQVVYAED